MKIPVRTNKRGSNPSDLLDYHKKISEGKLKNQALKCVARRLVNIVYSVMKHKHPYENPALGYVPDKKDVA